MSDPDTVSRFNRLARVAARMGLLLTTSGSYFIVSTLNGVGLYSAIELFTVEGWLQGIRLFQGGALKLGALTTAGEPAVQLRAGRNAIVNMNF